MNGKQTAITKFSAVGLCKSVSYILKSSGKLIVLTQMSYPVIPDTYSCVVRFIEKS